MCGDAAGIGITVTFVFRTLSDVLAEVRVVPTSDRIAVADVVQALQEGICVNFNLGSSGSAPDGDQVSLTHRCAPLAELRALRRQPFFAPCVLV